MLNAMQSSPEYSLEELLLSCTEDRMRLDNEDRAWLDNLPAGKEAH